MRASFQAASNRLGSRASSALHNSAALRALARFARSAYSASALATCARAIASNEEMYNTAMQDLIRRLLAEMGEDPTREGLLNTPKRVEKAYRFLTSGYDADIDQILNNALFTVDYSEMVIVKDIDFYSLCEHHLLPFFGKCHVAYIPSDKVIGLSKIPRLVDVFARRLQVQERLTNQIADTIRDKIAPLGVAVVMEATHLCMSMRGVEKQNSVAVTSAMIGAFRDNARTRMEFLELIKVRGLTTTSMVPSPGLACVS